jgi:hypothetical protein
MPESEAGQFHVAVQRVPNQPFLSIIAVAPVISSNITLHWSNMRETCMAALELCDKLEAEEKASEPQLKVVHNGRTTTKETA